MEVRMDNKKKDLPITDETQLQYDYIEKAKQYVKAESERLGRPLFAAVITFGCQMNTEREIEKAA